jgi:hypothetical protein
MKTFVIVLEPEPPSILKPDYTPCQVWFAGPEAANRRPLRICQESLFVDAPAVLQGEPE